METQSHRELTASTTRTRTKRHSNGKGRVESAVSFAESDTEISETQDDNLDVDSPQNLSVNTLAQIFSVDDSLELINETSTLDLSSTDSLTTSVETDAVQILEDVITTDTIEQDTDPKHTRPNT